MNEKIEHETEIAEVAKIFLEINNWNVYPEVVIDLFNGRPDFICKKNESLCHVIECKKTLSYQVLEQLTRWRFDSEKRKHLGQDFAIPHLLSAFVGKSNTPISDLKKKIFTENRIGLYSISKRKNLITRKKETPYIISCAECYWYLVHGDFVYTIIEEISPKIQNGSRKTAHKIIKSLHDDMKIANAGSKGGDTEYMTPFKRTINRVKEVLSDGKERHIQQIVEDIKKIGGHHYCSDKVAAMSISKFIDKFEIAKRSRSYGAWFIL